MLNDRIENHLHSLFQLQPKQEGQDIQLLRRSLAENDHKQANLLQAIELGQEGMQPRLLLERLAALQREKEKLQDRLLSLTQESEGGSR